MRTRIGERTRKPRSCLRGVALLAALVVFVLLGLVVWIPGVFAEGLRNGIYLVRARLRPPAVPGGFRGPRIRAIIRGVLVELGKPHGGNPVRRVHGDADRTIIDELEAIGTSEAVDALVWLLRHPEVDGWDPEILMALGRIGTHDAIEAVDGFEDEGEARRSLREEERVRYCHPWYARIPIGILNRIAGDRPNRHIARGPDGRLWMVSPTEPGICWARRSVGRDRWESPVCLGHVDDPQGLLAELVAGRRSLAEFETDTDADGLSDHFEEWLGTDPSSTDTDGDGVPDALDGNPLTPPHGPSEAAEMRQAVFTWFAASRPPHGVITIAGDGPWKTQEYRGYPGWIVPADAADDDSRLTIVKLSAERTGEDTAVGRLEHAFPGVYAYCSVVLRRRHGRWVVTEEHDSGHYDTIGEGECQ